MDNHEKELNEGDAAITEEQYNQNYEWRIENIEEENIVNENYDVNLDEEQVRENLQVN